MRLIVLVVVVIFFYFAYNFSENNFSENNFSGNKEYYVDNLYGYDYPENPRKAEFNTLLSFWDKIANLYKINYTITYGTYLGWYRNQNYIPYDEDLDIHISIDSVKNLLDLIKYEWCFYPHELRDNRIKPETPTLLINPDHNFKFKSRKRHNCQGEKVDIQQDVCSFSGIIGRLVYRKNGKTSHLDIFVYNHETNKTNRDNHLVEKRAVDYYGDTASYIVSDIGTNLPPTTKCNINGVTTRCFNRDIGKQFLINRYGENFLTPDRIYKNKKWNKK